MHALIGPIATKKKAHSGHQTNTTQLPPFEWKEEHEQAFQSLKDALVTAPVLGYPDYTKPFMLETDASLKGLGVVLSQRSDDGEIRPIAYASQSLHPSEESMCDYSSAKLELMWSVCNKFKDYLLGSRFTEYTDNNPLVYVKTSKLGAAQIRLLSELALFDFDIVYQTGRTNCVADALSRRPKDPDSSDEHSDSDSDDYETISYGTVCTLLNQQLKSSKIPHDVKCYVQEIGEQLEVVNGTTNIQASVNSVTVFNQISLEIMAQHQHSDNQLSLAYQHAEDGKKPTNRIIYKVRSKSSHKLLLGFSRLTLKQGVLHWLYINNDEEYHQLVLPEHYCEKVLKSLHDDMGHQGLEQTLAVF